MGGRVLTVLAVVAPLLFLASLVALVTVSTLSLSLTCLYVALGVFLACSLVWVVVQLVRGRGAPMWLVIGGGVGLIVAGLVALGVYEWVTPADALPLITAILIFLGLALLVEALRRLPRLTALPGAVVLAAGAALLVLAVLVLPHVADGWYVALLVCIGVSVLLAIPVGLNLMSEGALRTLARSRWRAAYVTGAGVVLAGAAFVAAGIGGGAWTTLGIATAAVLVLMLAVVSDTHADIAIVLAVLTLIAAAPPEHAGPPRSWPGKGSRCWWHWATRNVRGGGVELLCRHRRRRRERVPAHA